MYLGPVYITAEKFENRTLFLCLGLRTVHTNPSRKQSFSHMLFKPEEFKNTSFALSVGFKCGQKTFWK